MSGINLMQAVGQPSTTALRNTSLRASLGSVNHLRPGTGPYHASPTSSGKSPSVRTAQNSAQSVSSTFSPAQQRTHLFAHRPVGVVASSRGSGSAQGKRPVLKSGDGESSEDDIDPRDLLPASLGLGGSSDEESDERCRAEPPTPKSVLIDESVDQFKELSVGQDASYRNADLLQEDYRRGFRRKTSGGGGTTQWGAEVTWVLGALKKGVNVKMALSALRRKLGVPEWNKIMQAAGSRSWQDAWTVFQEMKQAAAEGANCMPDERSYTTIITILGGKKMVDDAEEQDSKAHEERAGRVTLAASLFNEMATAGLVQDQFAHNALMGAYANAGDHQGACDLLNRMRVVGCPADLITYGKVVDACIRGGLPLSEVMGIFKDMQEKDKLQPDMDRFYELVAALSREHMVEEAEAVLEALRAAGAVPLRKTYGAVLEMYAHLGLWRDSKDLLQRMRNAGLEPNSRDSELLIEAYASGGRLADALSALRQMHAKGSRSSLRTYLVLVEACGRANLPDKAGQVFTDMLKARVRPTAQVYGALVEAYGRCGRSSDAEKTFFRMEQRAIEPTQRIWAALIGAYGQAGWAPQAREAFQDLLRRRVQPGRQCFGALVEAYSKAGWLQDIASTLQDMHATWHLEPDPPTFLSALGALSRADSWLSAAPLIRCLDTLSRNPTPIALFSRAAYSLLSIPSTNFERNVWLGIGRVLEGMKTSGREVAEGWSSVLLDALWTLGLRDRAGKLMMLAQRLGYYPALWRFNEQEWVVDTRGLSVGCTELVLALWLGEVARELGGQGGAKLPWNLAVVTGGSGHVGNSPACRAVASRLQALQSPFTLTRGEDRRFVAGAVSVGEWLSRGDVASALRLTDVEVPVHLLVEPASALRVGWASQRPLSPWVGGQGVVAASAAQGIDWSVTADVGDVAWSC